MEKIKINKNPNTQHKELEPNNPLEELELNESLQELSTTIKEFEKINPEEVAKNLENNPEKAERIQIKWSKIVPYIAAIGIGTGIMLFSKENPDGELDFININIAATILEVISIVTLIKTVMENLIEKEKEGKGGKDLQKIIDKSHSLQQRVA